MIPTQDIVHEDEAAYAKQTQKCRAVLPPPGIFFLRLIFKDSA